MKALLKHVETFQPKMVKVAGWAGSLEGTCRAGDESKETTSVRSCSAVCCLATAQTMNVYSFCCGPSPFIQRCWCAETVSSLTSPVSNVQAAGKKGPEHGWKPDRLWVRPNTRPQPKHTWTQMTTLWMFESDRRNCYGCTFKVPLDHLLIYF